MSETNKLVTVVSEGSRLRITIWQPFIGWGEPMINNECAIENRTSGRWQQMTTTDADCLRNDLEQPIDGRYLHAPYRSIAPRNRNVSVEKYLALSLGLRFGFHSLLVAVSLFFLGGRRRRHPRERRVSIIDRLFPFHDTAARHRGSN